MTQTAIRPVTEDDYPRWAEVVADAQGRDHTPDSQRRLRRSLDLARTLGAFDGPVPVGGIAAISREMTLPGGLTQPVAGIGCAAVAPTHRRQGIFAQLIRRLFTELHHQGTEPIAVLNSSHAEVYSRFGFGMASQSAMLEGDTRFMDFRPDVEPGTGQVRAVTPEDASSLLMRVHHRARRIQVGWAERSDAAWDRFLFDAELPQLGMTRMRYVVHWDPEGMPQGYALYRFAVSMGPDGRERTRLVVPEVVAVTRSAHATLWRFLLDLDAADHVSAQCAPDEPVQYMVEDPAALTWTMRDAFALRLVDVQRALSARRYSAPCDVVFEVTDHLCEWNHDRFRLQADASGVMCVRTREQPDLLLNVQALGAAFLGGTSLVSLALAGRVVAIKPAALQSASVALRGFRDPWCPSGSGWPWY